MLEPKLDSKLFWNFKIYMGSKYCPHMDGKCSKPPNFLLAIMGYDTPLGLSSEMGVPIFCFEMECKFRVCFLTPIKKSGWEL